MAHYVYKCNQKKNKYSEEFEGDNHWKWFFDTHFEAKSSGRWGLTDVERELMKLQPGDLLLAYQVDDRMLYGVVEVVEFRGNQVILRPTRRLMVKITKLKANYPQVDAIPAFLPDPDWPWLAQISETDFRIIQRAAANTKAGLPPGRITLS